MGNCPSSCTGSSLTEPSFECVRIVHANGFLEDFAAPVTVSDVVAMPAKNLLCSPAHLLLVGSPLLRPDDLLEPGRVYFLLPHSVFHSAESSPVDLASLVNRLTAVAKQAGPADPAAVIKSTKAEAAAAEAEMARPIWKPMLETIRELSFRLSMTRDSNASFGSNGRASVDREVQDVSVQMEPLEECESAAADEELPEEWYSPDLNLTRDVPRRQSRATEMATLEPTLNQLLPCV